MRVFGVLLLMAGVIIGLFPLDHRAGAYLWGFVQGWLIGSATWILLSVAAQNGRIDP